ncbi:OmpA family protein [Maridesulfovibrio hydrothermalis]|uniref:OmpA/MotB domain protein n=1 Tax=Maridesulfovibrio hydrothermalis AM13 = DSM 14728 TaxID=1121451 RepID=L0REH4_9BACT|nr:OmpA family protein [Maridesulfovibrio hydrothermalis]CCO25198.1 OmpA/MotB domain protein [Maridesulfovibrio hydrothermalis AM13 = DSM 14728]
MKKYLIIFVLLLSACTKFEPQIATQSIYYEDATTQLSQLMVYSRPEKPHYGPLSALFYPFHITQTMPKSQGWGQQITKGVWQNWTSLQIFPSMVYDETLVYRGLEEALFTARSRGYDLLVTGFVPYLYLGHTMDDSALTLQVKIYETKRGQMVCSFEQSGRVEKKMDDDFLIIKREHRMPDSAFFQIVQAIATDMAVPLTSWARYEKTNQGMIAGLMPDIVETSAPQPAPRPVPQHMQKQKLTAENPVVPSPAPLAPEPVKKTAAKVRSINLAVQFDVDSAEIKPESYPLMNELGKALISDKLKGKKITIAGHTDSDASPEYNTKLSKERAESVKKYLTTNFPIAPSRIATTGFGESKPLVPNTTKYNKLLNRRVQVSITP